MLQSHSTLSQLNIPKIMKLLISSRKFTKNIFSDNIINEDQIMEITILNEDEIIINPSPRKQKSNEEIIQNIENKIKESFIERNVFHKISFNKQ